VDRGMLEVLPLTHIRGRSLHDAFVVVDFTSPPPSVRHVRRNPSNRLSRTCPAATVRDTVGSHRPLSIGQFRGPIASEWGSPNVTRSRRTGQRHASLLRASHQSPGLC
jgi:hypothetical protein